MAVDDVGDQRQRHPQKQQCWHQNGEIEQQMLVLEVHVVAQHERRFDRGQREDDEHRRGARDRQYEYHQAGDQQENQPRPYRDVKGALGARVDCACGVAHLTASKKSQVRYSNGNRNIQTTSTKCQYSPPYSMRRWRNSHGRSRDTAISSIRLMTMPANMWSAW